MLFEHFFGGLVDNFGDFGASGPLPVGSCPWALIIATVVAAVVVVVVVVAVDAAVVVM